MLGDAWFKFWTFKASVCWYEHSFSKQFWKNISLLSTPPLGNQTISLKWTSNSQFYYGILIWNSEETSLVLGETAAWNEYWNHCRSWDIWHHDWYDFIPINIHKLKFLALKVFILSRRSKWKNFVNSIIMRKFAPSYAVSWHDWKGMMKSHVIHR